MIRRALAAAGLSAVLLAALPAPSALAYTTPPDTTAVTGTDTIPYGSANTYPITSLEVQYPANPFRASGTTVVFDYYLTAWCGVVGGQNEYVMGSFTVTPAQWTINDTGGTFSDGTLSITGMSVPASYVGDTFSDTGLATITAGTGPLGPVVYGADTAAEKKTVASYHKKINTASTATLKASYLNQLRGALL